jgi:Protein of unknown function (DUF3667).
MKWDHVLVWLASRLTPGKRRVRHEDLESCLNCDESLEKNQYFCPNCGQKVHSSHLTIWSLLSEFFSGLFNLDNSVYKSLYYLPIPGYLSKKFISGQRKKYVNPIRLFIVALIIHIAVLSDIIPINEVSRRSARYMDQLGQKKAMDSYYDAKETLSVDLADYDLDSLEHLAFHEVNIENDTFIISPQNTSSDIQLLDMSYKFLWVDMYELEEDLFLEKYKPKNYWEKIGMLQLVRALRNPAGAIRFGMGNLLWSVLSAIIILGFLMKLLYIRNNKYYVEHLVVLFNIHSFAFLIASLALYYAARWRDMDTVVDEIAYIIIVIFFFLSLKYYYQQGWLKTFIKFVLIGISYFIVLIAMIVLVTIVSLFFFK